MVPSIFGENLFDEFWNDPFDMDRMLPRGRDPLYGKHSKNLMKTDVRETEGSYELDVDLPGFKKEEVNVELNNGYLTIEAAKSLDKDDTDKQGRYIRQERYAGSMSRSFYVGEGLEPKDIRAKFENGILQLSIPKSTPKQLPKTTAIAIEGVKIKPQKKVQANKFGLHLFARLAASQPSPHRGSLGVRRSQASPSGGGGSAKPRRRGRCKFDTTSQSAFGCQLPCKGSHGWCVL